MSEHDQRLVLMRTFAGLLAAAIVAAELKELAHVPPMPVKPHVEPPEYGASRSDVGMFPVEEFAESPGLSREERALRSGRARLWRVGNDYMIIWI